MAFCKQKKKRLEHFILNEIVAITFKGDAGYLIKKLNTFKKSFNSKDNKSIIILKENQEIKSDELKIKRGRLCANRRNRKNLFSARTMMNSLKLEKFLEIFTLNRRLGNGK